MRKAERINRNTIKIIDLMILNQLEKQIWNIHTIKNSEHNIIKIKINTGNRWRIQLMYFFEMLNRSSDITNKNTVIK